MNQDIVLTKFKLQIPKDRGLSILSRKLEGYLILILSLMPLTKDQGNCLLQIRGNNINSQWEKIAKILEKEPIIESEILGRTPEFILLNLKMKAPWILQTIIKYQMMLHYPLRINGGKIEFELISSRNKIDSLFNAFEKKKLQLEIQKIGTYKPKNLLTPRQEEILIKAHELGYYEVPRRISLSQLAKVFLISPSALSENLRRIEKRLAIQYLNT